MTNLSTEHWSYFLGKPEITAVLKQQPEDFQVTEILPFEPCGEGEHIFLWIEKTGLNTAFVGEQLAKFTGLHLRNVSFAGRKDKHAVTKQWFSIHAPGNQDFDWSSFELEGCRILNVIRHNKKLRTGSLSGNRFSITLRELNTTERLEERLNQIQLNGVPNYYGQQRFGEIRQATDPQTGESLSGGSLLGGSLLGGNLALAQKMIQGEEIRNRNKRSMAISALRSWLFNEFVHQRLQASRSLEQPQPYEHALPGDVFILSGSNSFFSQEELDETIHNRLHERDINLSAPLWGKGELDSKLDALKLETEIAAQFDDICQHLASLGLKQERRNIWLFPKAMQWQIQHNTVTITFELPSGCFATSVIRELANTL
ncbi:tRNA pseudouridine(13) synthase TruD [Paraneptunicella aestuarii]|uniref:tRNA pseudouridine(13) synthase TruD n=1 Tax=Paraneptunicella aestuarii TaxID=2831148 RepID=UPI001E570627|nr:tRNA pseudouridine(13) synthase TruD [Paraneptunicella aestuarii]UAA38119.1 tRNA pseudouridine(13) synthase TruD [Paraneptunicella aestuarii]